jgi:hypothetical protein
MNMDQLRQAMMIKQQYLNIHVNHAYAASVLHRLQRAFCCSIQVAMYFSMFKKLSLLNSHLHLPEHTKTWMMSE